MFTSTSAGCDFQEQAADRVAPLHQGGVVAFEQGEVQPTVLHGAAVDEQVLVFASGARDTRRRP